MPDAKLLCESRPPETGRLSDKGSCLLSSRLCEADVIIDRNRDKGPEEELGEKPLRRALAL